MTVTDKVALVTGAGQGIGRAIALRLAEDGFNVAVADLDFQKDKGESVVAEIEALGRKAIFVAADVAKRDQVVAAVDAAAEKLGGFDVIVNNAGIAQVNPLLNVTEDELNKIFQINVN